MKEDTLNISSTSALLLIKVINLQSKDCLFPVKKKKKKSFLENLCTFEVLPILNKTASFNLTVLVMLSKPLFLLSVALTCLVNQS